ncbi:MAG: YbaB/EbfC family nucleoid-associated protein [Ruminococcaceae bacterium]|nr:YbaB/EbfC family nucleoid-associated protein [Oscillospiraceae bacterium]
MKSRLPKEFQNKGAGNMNSMIKQAQKMQEDIERVQAELEERDFTATAAGGMIEVTMSGAKVLKDVKLNPEIVDKDAIEDLQDTIIAGINAVITMIEEATAAEMEKVTGGVNIPGLI